MKDVLLKIIVMGSALGMVLSAIWVAFMLWSPDYRAAALSRAHQEIQAKDYVPYAVDRACTCAGKPQGCETKTFHSEDMWSGNTAHCAIWTSPRGRELTCCVVFPKKEL